VPPLPDHQHCRICGRSCPADQKTCSDEHAQRYEAAVRARRNYVYLLVGAGALLLILLVSHYAV
jgi:predicted nucleic acid-binding Zn ribbon protein